MSDTAPAKEGALPLVRAVDELIDDHKAAWRQFFLERAARRQRDEIGNPGPLEHIDIGAVIDVRRRMAMTLVVARQKHDRQPGQFADPQRCRWLAPRTVYPARAHILEPRQVVDA